MELELIAPDRDEERLAVVLKALGHPLRLGILKYVAGHPGCICNDIVVRTGKSQSTVSQHLHILYAAGLLESVHDGRTTSYFIDRQTLGWLRGALDLQVLE